MQNPKCVFECENTQLVHVRSYDYFFIFCNQAKGIIVIRFLSDIQDVEITAAGGFVGIGGTLVAGL